MRAPPVQILSISCSFWENLAKSYAGAPHPWRVGARTSGKSSGADPGFDQEGAPGPEP